MADFVMPKLGADMSAGTLVAWHKKPGDVVRRGDIVAEVETDKGVIEVEIFTSGTIERLLIQPGESVPIGTALATVREEAAAMVGMPSATPKPPAPVKPAAPPTPPAPHVPTGEIGRVRISPSARELARKLEVDPSTVQGTGPRGAITREDIERAAAVRAAPAPAAPPLAADRLTRMRQTIAAAMTRSKREIPHYYLSTTIDMHHAMTWLTEENLKRPVTERLLYGVLLLKVVALALREVPELNAVWADGQVVTSQAIHVGVAISLRRCGLIAPALHDTDRQSLGELMGKFRDLVSRARAGSLRSSELSDPTITVTSLGEQGVETLYPIIYPPQVAIVGFGKVVERPWVADGQVVARPVITATLSADHRVSDGHRGGLFLAAVDRLLQEPSKL
ncbi:MAG TPA: dihydrolipoamide acetyltransferase family protein [Gemmataceae bacterium]|nr:dihydrolipoamide acetyltransferase family protein [Gemmataceae bacterium]